MRTAVELSKQAMLNAGLEPPVEILADGVLHSSFAAEYIVQSYMAWLTSNIRNLLKSIASGGHHGDE
mgnify:CR=1 FL=1